MKILLSNDDGVFASGIDALFEELSQNYQTTLIAPAEERSTTGHSLSLNRPLRLKKLKENYYSCDGFPSDCILMGLGHVLRDARPDLVISGINRGANLGQDLYYSGTMAAAREAVFHNVPAIAASLVLNQKDHKSDYIYVASFIKELVDKGVQEKIAKGYLLNINFPQIPHSDISGVKLTQAGFREYSEEIISRIDSRGREYFWIGGNYLGHNQLEFSDCSAIEKNHIALSLCKLPNAEKEDSHENLKAIIDELDRRYV